jgi:uncharacterized membrane protein HdeD (DUF308 family)
MTTMIADSLDQITANWWTFVVRGVFALAIAAFAFAAPTKMAAGLVYFVAAFFIVSGLVSVFAGISFTGSGHWWALILMGLVQGALGIYMLATPGVGPLALAYLVAIWAFSAGLLEIMSAIALRRYIDNEVWWVLLGILTVALGVYVVIYPALGVLALVYAIGIYAALAGISLIGLGFRIKNARTQAARRLPAF